MAAEGRDRAVEEAATAFLNVYRDTDRSFTEAEWEVLDEAEDKLSAALGASAPEDKE